MEYIEWMNNLRHAMKVVASKAPEIIEVIESKAIRERDQDLGIALMRDETWYKLQKKYEEVEPKLYQFYPEEEFGAVHTMWAEDMKGDER